MEDVAMQVPNGLRFLQMYSAADQNLTLQHVGRAEESGYTALVLTLDATVFGKRLCFYRNEFWSKQLPSVTFGNLIQPKTEPKHCSKSKDLRNDKNIHYDRHITPVILKWLVRTTRLPVIIKGILTGEDAKLAVDCGVSGILVSNHGARQLDTVLSTIDALPEVVAAVNGRCEVYMDGGVRHGTDIFKALALGAKAVFVGRPSVYALVYNGTEGVTDMLNILKEEFYTTMVLSGCSSVNDIRRDMVVQETAYKSQL